MVIDAGYTPPQPAKLVGVGSTGLRRWVEGERILRASATPQAMAAQKLLIEELQAKLKASQEECDVLKKSLPQYRTFRSSTRAVLQSTTSSGVRAERDMDA